MSKVIGLRRQSPGTSSGSDARSEERFALIKGLVQTLEPHEQERLAREISETLGPVPKAGDVLATIAKFIGRQKTWTVSEIKKQIDDQGVPASPKEVYNAVGYLSRKGHIQRIGYGQYLVDGKAFVTDEDIGPDNRYEEAYKDQS